MTDCLQRHPGPLSWNSVLTQVLGSGGRETSKLGRQAGRVEEEEVRAGSWAAERETEGMREEMEKWRNRENMEQLN